MPPPLEQVRDLIVSAFDTSTFDEMLLFDMNLTRQNVVADGPLNQVVLGALKVARQEGWDGQLVLAVANRRKGRGDIQKMAREYAAWWVGRMKQDADNPKVREAYRDFGLAPAGFPTEDQLGTLQKIIDPANPLFNMTDWVARAARVEGRVCRVEVDGAPRGTGFLVGPNTALTNYHVVEAALAAPGRIKVRFDYKQLKDGTILSGTLFDVTKVIDSSPYTDAEKAGTAEAGDPPADHLDYALLEVAGSPGDQPVGKDGPKRGWVRVPDGPLPPPAPPDPFAADQAVLIAQHPKGTPLKLAIEWRSVLQINAARNRVRHRTNTEPGSSGSPSFDRNWNFIALHHYGDPDYWNPKYNQGVPAAAVRGLLTQRGHADRLGGDCD